MASISELNELIATKCATIATKMQNLQDVTHNRAMKKVCERSFTDVTIPDGVTVVGNYAYAGCADIVNVAIPSQVVEIGSYAFNSCTGLTLIYIPANVSVVGANAFGNCPNLTIHCEAESQPETWSTDWNPDGRPVVWAHTCSKDSAISSVVTPPTCVDRGYTTYTCICGDTFVDDYMETTEHTYVDGLCSACGFELFTYTNYGSKEYSIQATDVNAVPAEVTIPDSYNGLPVTLISNSAFEGCSSLTSINIPDGVTSIGDHAFMECSNLTIFCEAASLPDGWNENWNVSNCPVVWGHVCTKENATFVSTVEPISCAEPGYTVYRCNDCGRLFKDDYVKMSHTYVDNVCTVCGHELFTYTGVGSPISYYNVRPTDIDTVPAEVTIPSTYNGKTISCFDTGAFKDCTSLITINIPDSITLIDNETFQDCSNLINVKISENSKMTIIGGSAFKGCISLTNITIPDSVTRIFSWAFEGCTNLTSVEFGENSKLTNISSMAFSGCSGLTSITIPDGVTSIGSELFYGCSSLTSINIPNGVTSIDRSAFNGCSSLTSITIPDTVTSIGKYTFSGCSSLTSITIPDSVTSIGESAFNGCSSLTIYCEAATQPDGWDANWNIYRRPVVWGHTCSKENATVISTVQATCSAQGYTLYKCNDCGKLFKDDYTEATGEHTYVDGLCSVCGHELFTITSNGTIAPVSMDEVPSEMVIPSVYKGTTVTSIGDSAFMECASLTSVIIPDSVTRINYRAFFMCNSLANVTLGNSVTYIDIDAFARCPSLESIAIPNSATIIHNSAFERCTSLESIIIPSKVEYIGMGVFSRCTSLTDINVDGNNTKYTSIDGNLYTKDEKTLVQYAVGKMETSFTIPDPVTTIYWGAFYGCTVLENIIIPDGVTSIDNCAFDSCSNLTNITIGGSVTSIGDGAFSGCRLLTSITYAGTVAQWNTITLGSDWKKNVPATEVVCSDGTVAL